jgi:hypothetical protein
MMRLAVSQALFDLIHMQCSGMVGDAQVRSCIWNKEVDVENDCDSWWPAALGVCVYKGKELQARSETALAPLMAPSAIKLSSVGKRKNPTMGNVAIVPFSA